MAKKVVKDAPLLHPVYLIQDDADNVYGCLYSSPEEAKEAADGDGTKFLTVDRSIRCITTKRELVAFIKERWDIDFGDERKPATLLDKHNNTVLVRKVVLVSHGFEDFDDANAMLNHQRRGDDMIPYTVMRLERIVARAKRLKQTQVNLGGTGINLEQMIDTVKRTINTFLTPPVREMLTATEDILSDEKVKEFLGL